MRKRKLKEHRSFPMSDDDLFTAPEVARFCKVDLKTIHNWVDRQQIEHFRTPGRHLRFRRVDVIDFLRRFNYPVPDELQPRKPAVYVLSSDSAFAAALKRTCGAEMALAVFDNVMDFGLRSGHAPPDAIILDATFGEADADDLVGSLRQSPVAASCRVILCSDRQPGSGDFKRAAVDGWVPRASMRDLRSTLEALLGS